MIDSTDKTRRDFLRLCGGTLASVPLPDEPLNSGNDNHVYPVGDGRVVVVMQDPDDDDKRETLEASVSYMDEINENTDEYDDHTLAPDIDSLVTNEDGEVIGYVTDEISGQDLAALIEGGGLSDEQRAEIARQIRDQLAILREEGYGHHDLDTSNVMVDIAEDGSVTVYLMDYRAPDDSQPRSFWAMIDLLTFQEAILGDLNDAGG